MHVFQLFLSPRGRLGAGCFAGAVILAYAFSLAANLLTAPALLASLGLWPFVLAQAALIWVWYALHAKRLHDAGRSVASAQGIAVIYVLALMLLIIVGAFFLEGSAAAGASTPASVQALRELFYRIGASLDPFVILALVACLSLVMAPIFSVWAMLRPAQP